MRHKGWIVLVLAWVVAAVPALAQEVVHFTNGTTLPVASHWIEDDMIHVDLGDDATMAFPKAVVEKIEASGKILSLDHSPANRMDPSTRVYAQPLGRSIRDKWETEATKKRSPKVQVDDNGVATMAVFPDAEPTSGRGKFRSVATKPMPVNTNSENGPIGTQRLGNRFLINRPNSETGGKKKNLSGLSPKR